MAHRLTAQYTEDHGLRDAIDALEVHVKILGRLESSFVDALSSEYAFDVFDASLLLADQKCKLQHLLDVLANGA